MIIEGILTTESADGSMHIAPLGPWVDPELKEWTLKPFQTSNTFKNLHRSGRGVFHVVDDSLLMAMAVLGRANSWEATFDKSYGWTLSDSCQWFALQMNEWDLTGPRATASTRLVHHQVQRPFWGWNRAKHAVVETAILASRVSMLDRDLLIVELSQWKQIVEKTAGPRELEAFALLEEFIASKLADLDHAT